MTWVLLGAVLVMSLVTVYFITRMGAVYKARFNAKHLPREEFERTSSRALIAMGVWQFTIATYLGYTTSWAGSIALYGAAAFLGFAGWYQAANTRRES